MQPEPIEEPEGVRVPGGLPPIVDAHVHVFPDRVFAAIQRWFDAHAWPIRYRMSAPGVLDFLVSRGIAHVVAFGYAHAPGMARELNRFLARTCAGRADVTPLGTVLPGEQNAVGVVEEAVELGLKGLKLHCHVQCFAPDDPAAREIYALCADAGLPIVMHAGREPASGGYRCNPRALCAAEKVANVLREHPRLALVVPHLGVDEVDDYRRLLLAHENLWLDTTMMLSGFFPGYPPVLDGFPPERLLYGSDFPNIPYAWDRELVALARLGLPERDLARVAGGTAAELFGISLP
jgi:predicted TIM-barrel fold metal-dependent hydrolase